jgi:hypothetical protein
MKWRLAILLKGFSFGIECYVREQFSGDAYLKAKSGYKRPLKDTKFC